MKTYISKFVNRQYEQIILNLICSFTASRIGCVLTKMQIFIRKNRHIGTMYVHQTYKSKHICRSRYDASKWKYSPSIDIRAALSHLRSFEHFSNRAGLQISTSGLIGDLADQSLTLHLY